MTNKVDMVSHPPHYAANASGLEVIEVTEKMNFNLGNAYKYVARFEKKNNPVEDLEKAKWYLNREFERGLSADVSKVSDGPDANALAFAHACDNEWQSIALENIAIFAAGGGKMRYKTAVAYIEVLIVIEKAKRLSGGRVSAGGITIPTIPPSTMGRIDIQIDPALINNYDIREDFHKYHNRS